MIPPMGILIKILLSIFTITSIEARPISYSGGSTLMSMSDNMKDSTYYHYSPTYKYSVGIESVNDKFFDKDYIYLRLTYLLNRKNTKNSQRNLYFQSAISPDDLNDNFSSQLIFKNALKALCESICTSSII